MVISIEAKKVSENKWVAYFDNGREKTQLDALAWAIQATDLGAGEIYLMSVDQEGRGKGVDLELVNRVSEIATVPLIVGGGIGKISHVFEITDKCSIEGVSIAHALHYNVFKIGELKECSNDHDVIMRYSK